MKICISGAGIAGPTLAYWLLRTGHEVTIVEKSPVFRTGGYIIDFWGVGYDVAERMGIVEAIRTRGYDVQEVRLMKGDGHKGGGFSTDVFRRLTHDRFTSLRRGDLAHEILKCVRDKAEVLFGRTILSIDDKRHEVTVKLSDESTRSFDLVIGADGLHSQVRRLVWGDQTNFERRLGYYVAAFEMNDYRHRDEDVYVNYAEPGLSVSRFSMRQNKTMWMLVFRADHPIEAHNDEAKRSMLRSMYGECGWETPEMLAALNRVEDIYFDRVSQIEVPSWSKGRCALIGDAAACVSLLAGEGTGLAMTEAYVLTGELHASGGDIPAALAAYEAKLRPFLTGKQESARSFASAFAPKTELGIWLRNIAARFMAIPRIAALLVGGSVKDDFELPGYRM